jgi:hypothetical protein
MEIQPLLSSISKRLPPTRVLIGAGFALASYFVTSVWKAEIDDEIKKYSAVIDSASSIQTQLTFLPMFQASSRFWAQSIELQKTQIAALTKLAYPAPSVIDLQDSRAILRQEMSIEEFFGLKLPKEVQSLPVDDNFRPAPITKDYETKSIMSCMRGVGGNVSHGDENYGDKFAEIYQAAADRGMAVEEPSATFELAARNLTKTLNTGQSAANEISEMRPAMRTSPSSDVNHATASLFEQQRRAIRCIEKGENQILDEFFALSARLRSVVSDKLVKPLSDTKRRIEMVEVALYGMSGLVALFGSKAGAEPSTPPLRKPIGPPRSPEPSDRRYRKQRPVRRAPER